MFDRVRGNRFEGMDPEWLLKLFLWYIQWCIRELPESERIVLERLTPRLQAQFGCSGRWYEVIEEGCGLPRSGRKILASCWRDMRDDVSADEFAREFAMTFIAKANQRRRAERAASGPRKPSH